MGRSATLITDRVLLFGSWLFTNTLAAPSSKKTQGPPLAHFVQKPRGDDSGKSAAAW